MFAGFIGGMRGQSIGAGMLLRDTGSLDQEAIEPRPLMDAIDDINSKARCSLERDALRGRFYPTVIFC